MPKSRNRRNGRPRRPNHRPPPHQSSAPFPSLTARETQLWRESAEAELRGDAATALERYRQIGPVSGSEHQELLEQLVEHAEVLPDWVRARWLVAQAMRLDTPTGEDRHGRALRAAITTAYAEDPEGRRVSDDPARVLGNLMGRNWVYRQVSCFELGGLSEALSQASPELLRASGPVDEWADADLGGYRLDSVTSGVATLRDLASGRAIDILDVGTCAELEVGDHAIGRLVPINEEPRLMAESRLVPVPEIAALEIAWTPELWLDTVLALATGAATPYFSAWDAGSLCSDVPELAWRGILLSDDVLTDQRALVEAHRRITGGRHTRHEDAVLLLRGLLTGWCTIPPAERSGCAYYAGAALLAPGAVTAIECSSLVARVYEPRWRELAACLAEPARSVCLALADRCRGRAAS